MPNGFHSSKLGAPPALASSSMMTSVKALTRVAKAAPTMNATASSMRFAAQDEVLETLHGFAPWVG
jgi:hypothetical protein